MADFSDELAEYQSKLRSLALLYKEMKNRHDPAMESEDRIHKLIFSLTHDLLFYKDPDLQFDLRDRFIESLSDPPQIPRTPFYADQLLDEYLAVSSQVTIRTLRESLAEFFRMQVKFYAQMNFKMILSWAHFEECGVSLGIEEELDRNRKMYEDAFERSNRLGEDESFGAELKKPVPKTVDGTNLYLHDADLEYCNVSKEDLKIFILRSVEISEKGKKFTFFLKHLKYLAMCQKWEIWESAIKTMSETKTQSHDRMKILTGNDTDSAKTFLKSFRKPLRKEELPFQIHEIEMPPLSISNILQLQGIVMKISNEFGLKGEMELDDGHSLAYQVTHLFPELYELQKLKLDWVEYGNLQARQLAVKRLQNLHFMKSYRVTFIRKSSSCSETDVPVLSSFEVAYKKKTDWAHLMKTKIKTSGWMHKQQVRLRKIESLNSELEAAFRLIDQQNIAMSNKAVEEIVFRFQVSQKASEGEQQGENEKDATKKYFSILLAENITKVQTSQVKIPSQMIKTYYMLVLLKNRKMKNKIIDILNVLRSVQKRIVMDLNDFEFRENFLDYKISEKTKLQGRWDLVTEIDSELYVKDGSGEFVIYDCVLDDYKEICEHLIRLGSFYINKYSEHKVKLFSEIDVNALTSDLLELEYEFQLAKYQFVVSLLHIYDNSIEKTVQERLAYRIIKLLAQRPKLNLKNSYFYESYKSYINVFRSKANLINAIVKVHPMVTPLLSPVYFNIEDLFRLLSESSKTLANALSVESIKQQNFLTSAIWDVSLKIWKSVIRNNSKIFSAGVLLDKPEFIQQQISAILSDLETGSVIRFPDLEEGAVVLDEISLTCNYFKVWKLKEQLENYIEESKILWLFYTTQAKTAGKDLQNLDPLDWGTKMNPEIDEGPGTHLTLSTACSEIDKSLLAYMNFSDINCIRHLLLPWGLDELKAVLQYQVIHVQSLALATQINQAHNNASLRILSELKLFSQYSFIPNNYTVDWKELLTPKGVNKEKLEKFKQKTVLAMQKYFCNIFTFKSRSRVQTLERYKILVHSHGKGKKDKSFAMIARRIRVKVIGEYCFSILQDLYPLAFKVQILSILASYHKLVSVIPPSSYNFIYKGHNFYDSERGIVDFSVLPTVKYVLEYPNKSIEDLRAQLHQTDLSRTLLSYKYAWNLSHDLIKILQTLLCLVQTLHIRLFINFLSIPSEDVLHLWESIEYGELFYSTEKANVLEQTPETLIEDQISEAFSLLKNLNENQVLVEKEERTRYLALYTIHNFDIMTISILSTYHYVMITNKPSSAKELINLIERIFRCKLVNFLNSSFKVYQTLPYIRSSGLIQAAWIPQLDWAFLALSASERSRGFTVAIAVQLKTENFLRTFTSHSKLHEIKALIDFSKTDISLWRLKFNFYNSLEGEYEILQESYKGIIEEKADKLIKDVISKRDIAKVNAEIKVLKEFFALETCKEGVRVLEQTLKLINSAAENDEPYSIIFPDRHSPDYFKKVNLLTGFLNLLRNRGSIVQAPGGKAIVYTMKDLAGIVSRLADQSLRYKETEKREHLDKLTKQITDIKFKLADKQKKLLGYQKAKKELEKEVSDMVTARITQKGAQFMYEIDISQRQLKEIKENSHILELQVREKITNEYIEKYKAKVKQLDSLQEAFMNFQEEFSSGLSKSIDKFKTDGINTLKKFSNYSEKEEEQEKEAKTVKNSTLVILQNILRKLRENFQWTRLQEVQKFQKYINELREQLTSNKYLDEQLSESKSREQLLKKELQATQNSLVSTEKLESKLRQQIREMKSQEESLQDFKEENHQKILKMQQRVSKFKSFKEIDDRKVAKEKYKQGKILKNLTHAERPPEEQYRNFYNDFGRELSKLRETIAKEKQILWECEKMILVTQGELEGVEFYEDSQWKKRYYDLLAEQKEKRFSTVMEYKIPKKLTIKKSENTYFATPQRSNRSFN